MGLVQQNYYKGRNEISNLPRPPDANFKHANLQNNVDIATGQEGLEKDGFWILMTKVFQTLKIMTWKWV